MAKGLTGAPRKPLACSTWEEEEALLVSVSKAQTSQGACPAPHCLPAGTPALPGPASRHPSPRPAAPSFPSPGVPACPPAGWTRRGSPAIPTSRHCSELEATRSRLKCGPQNPYVVVLSPSTPECDLVWRQGLYRGHRVKVRSLGGRSQSKKISLQKGETWTRRCGLTGNSKNRPSWGPGEGPALQHLDLEILASD